MVRIWAALLSAALAASVALNLRQAVDFADFRDDTGRIVDRLARHGAAQNGVIDVLGDIHRQNQVYLAALAERLARSEAGMRRGERNLASFARIAQRTTCVVARNPQGGHSPPDGWD